MEGLFSMKGTRFSFVKLGSPENSSVLMLLIKVLQSFIILVHSFFATKTFESK